MNISNSNYKKYVVLSVNGRIDTNNYESFAAEIERYRAMKQKFFILDLAQLEYISSSGLRVFLSSLKAISAENGELILCALNERIRGVFEMSGFISLFKTVEKLEEI
jgi:anti-anti-sigma factor